MLACDDPDTLEGLQKQIDVTMEFARMWRLSVNDNKCAVMLCNSSKVEEVDFKRKWGDIEFSKECMWHVHIHEESNRKRRGAGRKIAPDIR